MKRFELSTLSWQGDALPLSYIRDMRSEILNPNIMHHRGSVGQEQPLAGVKKEQNTQEERTTEKSQRGKM